MILFEIIRLILLRFRTMMASILRSWPYSVNSTFNLLTFLFSRFLTVAFFCLGWDRWLIVFAIVAIQVFFLVNRVNRNRSWLSLIHLLDIISYIKVLSPLSRGILSLDCLQIHALCITLMSFKMCHSWLCLGLWFFIVCTLSLCEVGWVNIFHRIQVCSYSGIRVGAGYVFSQFFVI